jgi:hypothetical protein
MISACAQRNGGFYASGKTERGVLGVEDIRTLMPLMGQVRTHSHAERRRPRLIIFSNAMG